MGKERKYFALLSDFSCLKMCLFLFFFVICGSNF